MYAPQDEPELFFVGRGALFGSPSRSSSSSRLRRANLELLAYALVG
jgi:hypothetical protein